MIYNKIHFKSLKIVLGSHGKDTWIAYSRDTSYPVFNRVIKGSIEKVIGTLVYLFEARLQCAENCEGYSWNGYDSVQEWAEYVLNRYLFSTFDMYYEHTYRVVNYSYNSTDGTPCSLDDYVEDGITIKYWNAV